MRFYTGGFGNLTETMSAEWKITFGDDSNNDHYSFPTNRGADGQILAMEVHQVNSNGFQFSF